MKNTYPATMHSVNFSHFRDICIFELVDFFS